MAAKSVEFHEEARAEFEEASDWYLARHEAIASNFPTELGQALGGKAVFRGTRVPLLGHDEALDRRVLAAGLETLAR